MDILNKLFPTADTKNLDMYKDVSMAIPGGLDEKQQERWIEIFRCQANIGVVLGTRDLRQQIKAGDPTLDKKSAEELSGATTSLLFPSSKDRYSQSGKALWKALIDYYMVATPQSNLRTMIPTALAIYYGQGLEGVQRLYQIQRNPATALTPLHQDTTRASRTPTNSVMLPKGHIYDSGSPQLFYGRDFLDSKAEPFPREFIEKRTDAGNGGGCLWEELLKLNLVRPTRSSKEILAAITHGAERLQSPTMEAKAKAILATNPNGVAILIPYIPYNLDRENELDVVSHPLGKPDGETVKKYNKPLKLNKGVMGPPESFPSDADKQRWDAAWKMVNQHHAGKKTETIYEMTWDLYAPENKPYLGRFTKDPVAWEQAKAIVQDRFKSKGLEPAVLRENIEMIAQGHIWWDPKFQPPVPIGSDKVKPYKRVFMIEGEFKALAAAQMNLENLGNLAVSLGSGPIGERQYKSRKLQPAFFEIAGTSGVNAAYLSMVKNQQYEPVHSFLRAFDWEKTSDLYICPDGDAGKWGEFVVSGGDKHGLHVRQPGNIGVLSATVCAGKAFQTKYPHLSCRCVDLAKLEEQHQCKGLDEVYRKAGLGALNEQVTNAKELQLKPFLTWGKIQEWLLAAKPEQTGFDLITNKPSQDLELS